jgi:hypothetical protein
MYLFRRRTITRSIGFHFVVNDPETDGNDTKLWDACFARYSMEVPPNSMFNSEVLKVGHDVALMIAHLAVDELSPSLRINQEGLGSKTIKDLICDTNSHTIVLVCCYTNEYIDLLRWCSKKYAKHVVFFNGGSLSWRMCCQLVFGAVMLHATRPISIDEAFRVRYFSILCVCTCFLLQLLTFVVSRRN